MKIFRRIPLFHRWFAIGFMALAALYLLIAPRHGFRQKISSTAVRYTAVRANSDGSRIQLQAIAYREEYSGALLIEYAGNYIFKIDCPVFASVSIDGQAGGSYDSYGNCTHPYLSLKRGLHTITVKVMNPTPASATACTIFMSKEIPMAKPLPVALVYQPGVERWQFTLRAWLLFALIAIAGGYGVYALRRGFPKCLGELHLWLVGFGLAFVVALALMEAALRLFGCKPKLYVPVTVASEYKLRVPNARMNYRGTPLTVQEFSTPVNYNANGWRDHDYPLGKMPGTFRICIVGDSYVEAKEVDLEQAFHKRLELRLKRSVAGRAKQFEVIALGEGGKSTKDEIGFLREEGLRYAPDAVILTFFPGNDIAENSPVLNNRYLQWLAEVYFPKIVEARITSYDRLLRLPWSTSNRLLAERCAEFYSTHLYAFDRSVKREEMLSPQNEIYSRGALSGEWTAAWNATKEYILQMRDMSLKNDAAFYVVLVDSYHIPVSLAKRLDRIRPYRELVSFCQNNTIPCLNLQAELEPRVKAGETIHFRYDGHWTPRGHELAAEALYLFLAKQERVAAFLDEDLRKMVISQ
jgi:hypothetical protein